MSHSADSTNRPETAVTDRQPVNARVVSGPDWERDAADRGAYGGGSFPGGGVSSSAGARCGGSRRTGRRLAVAESGTGIDGTSLGDPEGGSPYMASLPWATVSLTRSLSSSAWAFWFCGLMVRARSRHVRRSASVSTTVLSHNQAGSLFRSDCKDCLSSVRASARWP